jgi:hypothetical protein
MQMSLPKFTLAVILALIIALGNDSTFLGSQSRYSSLLGLNLAAILLLVAVFVAVRVAKEPLAPWMQNLVAIEWLLAGIALAVTSSLSETVPTNAATFVCMLVAGHSLARLLAPLCLVVSWLQTIVFVIVSFACAPSTEDTRRLVIHAAAVVLINACLSVSTFESERFRRRAFVLRKRLHDEKVRLRREAIELREEVYNLVCEKYDIVGTLGFFFFYFFLLFFFLTASISMPNSLSCVVDHIPLFHGLEFCVSFFLSVSCCR